MASAPGLLSSPHLGYILSLLDKESDLLRCRLVCRKLQSVIEKDYHKMKKPEVDVLIRCGRTDDYDDLELIVSRINGCFQSFSLAFRSDGHFKYEHSHGAKNALLRAYLEQKQNEGSLNAFECFNDVIFEIMTKFEISTFNTANGRNLTYTFYAAILDNIQRTGATAKSCNISTPHHWELAVALRAPNVHMTALENIDDSLQFLRTDVGSIVIESNGKQLTSLAPLYRLIQEWKAGLRNIPSLSIRALGRERYGFLIEEVVMMLIGFKSAFNPDFNPTVRVLIARDIDGQFLNFTYDSVVGSFSIVDHVCQECTDAGHVC